MPTFGIPIPPRFSFLRLPHRRSNREQTQLPHQTPSKMRPCLGKRDAVADQRTSKVALQASDNCPVLACGAERRRRSDGMRGEATLAWGLSGFASLSQNQKNPRM